MGKIILTLLESVLVILSLYYCITTTAVYFFYILYPLVSLDDVDDMYLFFFYILPLILSYGVWVLIYIFYKPLVKRSVMSIYFSMFIIALSILSYLMIENVNNDEDMYLVLEPLGIVFLVLATVAILFSTLCIVRKRQFKSMHGFVSK